MNTSFVGFHILLAVSHRILLVVVFVDAHLNGTSVFCALAWSQDLLFIVASRHDTNLTVMRFRTSPYPRQRKSLSK